MMATQLGQQRLAGTLRRGIEGKAGRRPQGYER